MMDEAEANKLYADVKPAPAPSRIKPTPEQAQRYLDDAEFHARAWTLGRIIEDALPDTHHADALAIGIIGAAAIGPDPTVEGWPEWRAVYGRPASYIDADPIRMDNGFAYVTELTGPYTSQDAARKAATRNSTETHAWVIGYQTRQVTATEWQDEQ